MGPAAPPAGYHFEREGTLSDRTIRSLIAIIVALNLCGTSWAATAIGMATARGTFLLDDIRVERTGTLFEGSVVSTNAAASEVRLNTGTRVLLGAESRAKFYRNRITLDRGEGQISNATGYSLEAGTYRVEVQGPGTIARVALYDGSVHVSSLGGAFAVRSAQGQVLANVSTGENVRLGTAGDAKAAKVTGKIVSRGGRYYLTDEATKTPFELRGAQVAASTGKRVEVAGTLVSEGVIEATTVTAAAAGRSTTAVVAGVVIASGAAVGIGVGLTREEEKPGISR